VRGAWLGIAVGLTAVATLPAAPARATGQITFSGAVETPTVRTLSVEPTVGMPQTRRFDSPPRVVRVVNPQRGHGGAGVIVVTYL